MESQLLIMLNVNRDRILERKHRIEIVVFLEPQVLFHTSKDCVEIKHSAK